jgi:murein DD-endopeptidase MepM/ murein hydrolase activator NlpD
VTRTTAAIFVALAVALAATGCLRAPVPDGFKTAITCPVTGTVSFTNDWHAPRAGGRVHEGNDIFAPKGRSAVAAVDGTMRHNTGALQGNAVWLIGKDGTTFFYAHLDQWVGPDRGVKAGDVIGLVGNTGDASGGATHLHFEIHPNAGPAVNPYPSLVGACTQRTRSTSTVGRGAAAGF